jgi:serine/threonine protein kinase
MMEKTLGNYHILKKIGEGGMGSVYLARDLSLQREVALKVIAPELARSPQLMTRFRVEAIAQARLNHPCIATIHSFDHQEDVYYIVMEYVAGRTLKHIIRETGKISVSQALSIVSHILEGLDYAHGKGVLHRDIKPANIFITTDNSVKIGDFGIAKVEGIDGLTRAGSTLGTVHYSSPEQIRGDRMGPGTDIYSLGVTLYEMVTGVLPFGSASGSNFEIQQGHLEKTPAKPSTLTHDVPPEVDDLIMKSLAKSPADRFPGAAAFKRAMDAILGNDYKKKAAGKGKSKGVVLPDIKLPRLTIPKIKFPAVKVSSIKGKFKLPGNRLRIERIRRLLEPFKNKNILKPLQRIQTRTAGDIDRRRLLIILTVSLLILLIVTVIAFADNQDGKEYYIKINSHKDTKTQREEHFFINNPRCPGAFVAKTKQEE